MPTSSRLCRIFSTITLSLAAAMIVITSTLADNPVKVANVSAERAAADVDGANWMLNGRTFDSGHFSPLKQINDQNVTGLSLTWYMDVDSAMGLGFRADRGGWDRLCQCAAVEGLCRRRGHRKTDLEV